MSKVVAFGDIQLELAGEHATKPSVGKVKGYEWWQARGFDVQLPLLDAAGAPASEPGTVAFHVHRRQRPRMRRDHYAPDRHGIEAARSDAAQQEDDVFYEIPVPESPSSPGRVSFHEERPVLWWPVGVQAYATFRITAWFQPAEGGPGAFTEQEIEVYWMDVQGTEKAHAGSALR